MTYQGETPLLHRINIQSNISGMVFPNNVNLILQGRKLVADHRPNFRIPVLYLTFITFCLKVDTTPKIFCQTFLNIYFLNLFLKMFC
jgi:hypothetical protein